MPGPVAVGAFLTLASLHPKSCVSSASTQHRADVIPPSLGVIPCISEGRIFFDTPRKLPQLA